MKRTLPVLILFALCRCAFAEEDLVIQNPGFETADPTDAAKASGWNAFTESAEPAATMLSSEDSHGGATAMRLGFDGKRDGFVGITQEVRVEAGQKISFAGYFKKVDLKEGAYLKIGIEWKHADGTEITRVQEGDINAKTLVSGQWQRFVVSGAAPGGVSKAILTVTFYTGGTPSGAVLIDDMTLEKLK